MTLGMRPLRRSTPRSLIVHYENSLLKFKGLGRLDKHFLVKSFLESTLVDICFFQETKLSDLSLVTWRIVGGTYLDHFASLPARGPLEVY